MNLILVQRKLLDSAGSFEAPPRASEHLYFTLRSKVSDQILRDSNPSSHRFFETNISSK